MSLTRYKPEILESALGGRNCAAMAEHENGAWYLYREVDTLLAEKDAEIARLKERKSPDAADSLASAVNRAESLGEKPAYHKAAADTMLAHMRRNELHGEPIAELKDRYYTTCPLCERPWGAGEPHYIHRVAFHGRFVTSVFICCDCNAKISRGEI